MIKIKIQEKINKEAEALERKEIEFVSKILFFNKIDWFIYVYRFIELLYSFYYLILLNSFDFKFKFWLLS